MNSKKTANLLTMCIKAGKAVKGFDSACDSVKNGMAYCILTASDASEKTVKETNFICEKYSVPLVKTELSKDEMAHICGKVTAVIAICDKGFANGFSKINT